MDARGLAEAIMLQSIEDIFSSVHRKESLKFFRGRGFRLAADLAGLGAADRLRIRKMISRVMLRSRA